MENVANKPTCAKCNLVLPRQLTMESHLSKCTGTISLIAGQCSPFSVAWKGSDNNVTRERDDSEKIVPASQPLVFTQQNEEILIESYTLDGATNTEGAENHSNNN